MPHICHRFSIYDCHFDFLTIIETWQDDQKKSVNYIIHRFIWNLFKIASRKQSANEQRFNVDEFDFVFLLLFFWFWLFFFLMWSRVLRFICIEMTRQRCDAALFLSAEKVFYSGVLVLGFFFSFNPWIVSIILPHGPTSGWCQIDVWDK